MLAFNLKRLVELKGIAETKKLLINSGLGYQTVMRMLRNNTFVPTGEQLERICIALKCTPNDIYQWLPAKDAPTDLPLNGLKHNTATLQEKIKNMSMEQVIALEKLLENGGALG
jgi:DNA-binding Xre family transcriptional regulator